VSRDVARVRECPPVQKCTRLVPAKRPIFAAAGNATCRFTGFFFKPSGGLEPSTPFLPWRFQGVTRVHARPLATQFFLQIALLRDVARSFLMCPFCVRG
jgi:hypothetical protein